MDDRDQPFDLDEVPEWVKKATGVLAFFVVVVALLAVSLFVFFFIVRMGLWLLGV